MGTNNEQNIENILSLENRNAKYVSAKRAALQLLHDARTRRANKTFRRQTKNSRKTKK